MDDFSNKTEAPTQRRREQARRDGMVARSGDLTTGAVMLAALLLVMMSGARVVTVISGHLRRSFRFESFSLNDAARESLVALAPLLVGVVLFAVAVNVAQIGWPVLFSTSPKARRQHHSPSWLPVAILKIVVIAAIGYQLVSARLPQLISGAGSSVDELIRFGCGALFDLVLRLSIALLAFGLIDYAIQQYRLRQQLKMTRRELEEELRQTEGDPKIRSRRRQLAGALFRSRHLQSQ